MGKKKKGRSRNQTAKLLEALAKVLIGLAALITAIAQIMKRQLPPGAKAPGPFGDILSHRMIICQSYLNLPERRSSLPR